MTKNKQINLKANYIIAFMKNLQEFTNDYSSSLIENSYGNKIIKNIIIEDDLILKNDINLKHNIYFENCVIERLVFNKCNFEQLLFKNCVFNDNVLIENGIFNNFFWFQDCTFKSNFIVRNGFFENLFFENFEINNEIRIEGGNFKRLKFIPKSEKDIIKISGFLTFVDELELTSNNGIKIIAERTFIKKIQCKGYLNSNSRIDLNDIRNNFNIEFNNVKNDGKIYLNNFLALLNHPLIFNDKNIDIINESIFDDRKNEYLRLLEKTKPNTVSELYNNILTPNYFKEIIFEKYFSEITEIGEKVNSNQLFFKISNSSMGYIELIDFEVEQYKNIFIESSDLSSIKMINSSIPVKKNRILSKDKTYLNHYSIYNDLYVSTKNQNNIKDRNKYFQASQKYLLKNLKTNLFTNLPSIISNLISKLFSNYGQSWIQSLIVTVILSTSFFGFYLLSFKNIELDFSYEGWIFFQSNYLKFTPEFINPTHKIDFIENLKNEIGEWTRFFDFLGRIIVGIGIYETIKSFRKYVN